MDLSTPEGMAHGAFYEILELNLPILVHADTPVEGAIKIKNKMDEIAKMGK